MNPFVRPGQLLFVTLWFSLIGMFTHAGAADVQSDTPPPDLGATYELQMKTQRALGDLEGALAAAREWRAAVIADSTSAPWLIHDTQRAVTTLAQWVALPDSLREQVPTADVLTTPILDAYRQQQYDLAIELLDQQLDIRRRILPANHEDIAESLRRQGVVHMRVGRYSQAAGATHMALRMQRRISPDDHPNIAHTLHNLATIYRLMGDYAAAEPLYRDALAMRRRILKPDDMNIVSSIHNLAIFLSVKGDFSEAETLFREVLEEQTERLGAESSDVSFTLHNLGNSILESGRPDDAIPVLREALEATRRLNDEPNVYEAGNLHSLGSAYFDLGRIAAADSLLLEAESIYRHVLSDVHPNVVDVLVDRGLCRQAVGDLDGAEALLTSACSVHDQARLNVGSGYERSDFQASPYSDLAAIRLARGEGDSAWEATEHALARTLEDLLHSNDEQAPVPLNLEDLQQHLDDGCALLGWLTTTHRLHVQAWIYLVPSSGDVRWHSIPEDNLREALRVTREYRENLSRSGSWPFRVRDTARLDAMSRALFKEWIAPMSEELEGLERLVVLPSGDMLGVPVESLRDGTGQLMDDRLAISYAPSASIYIRLRSALRETEPSDRALLIGAPPIDSPALSDLPGARDEVQGLASVFPNASILIGAEASETALSRLNKAGELERFRWIHLATHASVDGINPDRSALILAPGTGNEFDGHLTAGEIIRDWKLSADLVTLSGCRTALGRPSRGEGYIGLAHAFLRAGARNLVVSLWPVDDEATRHFMHHFYANMLDHDRSPATALRLARAWMRDFETSEGDHPYRHPAYWSGFVLMGGD